ncbi:MAG: outer membrane beta-barrel protein [Saprospiraceae bacterium]
MRRIMLVFLFLSAVWTILPAQRSRYDQDFDRFRFGFQASPLLTWMSSDDRFINGNGQNLGIRVGTKIDYFFAEKYALTTGLNLGFNQGGRLLHDYGGDLLNKSDLLSPVYHNLPNNTNIRYHVNYVDVPIGLHFLTNEIARDFRFFFEVPVFNIAVLYNANGDISGPGLTTLEDENISKDVIPVNVSWSLGGGVEYNISGDSPKDTNLFAGIFYSQSFTDMTRNTGQRNRPDENGNITPETEDSKAILRGISIFLGIMF